MNSNGLKFMKRPNPYPQGMRCQKCLERGHWSYECKGKRKYLHRSSRTTQLKKALKKQKEFNIEEPERGKTKPQKKMRKNSTSSSGTDSSADSTTDSSSSSSSSSDSESDSSESDSSSSSSSSNSSSSSSSSNQSDHKRV